MTKQQSVFYWKMLPDRDEALEKIYAFIRFLHEHDPEKAAGMVMVRDMDYFQKVLHDSLMAYLHMVIEDEDWAEYENKNLALEVDDPAELDEDLMLPEFSGKHFVIDKNEKISVQVGLRGQVTPIRLHFGIQENDGLYYLRLQSITAK
jgi:hypothetical protein